MATIRLDNFGRIVIPRKSRARLGLRPGSLMEIDDSGDALVLRPSGEAPSLRRKSGVLVYTGEVQGDVDDPVRASREESLRRHLPRRR
jgi:AbrB family looped-hinge helix DNA binding protein